MSTTISLVTCHCTKVLQYYWMYFQDQIFIKESRKVPHAVAVVSAAWKLDRGLSHRGLRK